MKQSLSKFNIIIRTFVTGIGLSLIVGTASAAVVYQDTFDGTVLDSAWTPSTGGTASVGVSGGSLNLVDSAKSSTATVKSSLSSSFNFFETGLTFDVDVSSYSSAPAGSSSAYFMFMIGSTTTASISSNPDLFGIRIYGDNTYYVAAKKNSTSSLSNFQVESGDAGDAIANISVTLDATDYDVTFTTESGGLIQYTGEHGITLADWGTDGSSAIIMQQITGSSATNADFNINDLTVSEGTPGDVTLSGFQDTFDGTVLDSAWTASTEGTASVGVSGGNLNLVDSDKSSTATIRTALSSEFDFFQKELIFDVDISSYSSTPAASASAYFMFMIGSTTTASFSSNPDLFGIRIYGDNTYYVAIKTNSTSSLSNFQVGSGDAGSEITGISITLNATNYVVVLSTTSGGPIEYAGAHGIELADWGSDGRSAIIMQQITGSSATSADFNINELTVGGIAPTGYEAWASIYGLIGDDALPGTDIESDGFDNLMEYALNGNPTNADHMVIAPVSYMTEEGGTNYFYYIHNQRTDDPDLIYTLAAKEDLLTLPDWDTNDVLVVGESEESGGFKTVTNRTEASSGSKFVRLVIEK